jgi:hypothetical protein
MIQWQSVEKNGLPEPRRLVVAYLTGHQFHTGVMWTREGYHFMARLPDTAQPDEVVKDNWGVTLYDKALEQIGADILEVTHWSYLEKPDGE